MAQQIVRLTLDLSATLTVNWAVDQNVIQIVMLKSRQVAIQVVRQAADLAARLVVPLKLMRVANQIVRRTVDLVAKTAVDQVARLKLSSGALAADYLVTPVNILGGFGAGRREVPVWCQIWVCV